MAGERWTPGFNARVRLERCGEALCGRIVWLWDKSPKDRADRAPLLGRIVVEPMHTVEAGRWASGRLYDPEDARDCAGSLQLRSPQQLGVEGCELFVCRTQVWRRADPIRCPPVSST